MAEQERLTKKERREQARRERKAQEAEEAKRARRQRLIATASTVVVAVFVAAIVWQAFSGGTETIDGRTVAYSGYQDAIASAGCEVVSDQPLPTRDHLDPASAPPASALYTGPRPTHSGPHFSATHPVVEDGLEQQGEERALTHNLEHGAVIAWYDPEQVSGDTVDDLESWAESLNESGFISQAGAAVFVSPYTDPGISSGKAVALRAWGQAMDCGEWDRTVGDGFVIEYYGTHGNAPESFLSPYPDSVLGFSDREVEDKPQGEGGAHTPTEGETGGETGTATQAPTDGATATEGGTPTGEASPTG